MAKILPNDPCPCGSEIKFKKCCSPYLQGAKDVENPERLLRTRYAAYVNNDVKFLWGTLHSESPRKLNDNWRKFEHEHQLLRHLTYKGLKILDQNNSKKDQVTIVYWVQVFEGDQELSFVEEGTFRLCEGRWHFFDGLRKSSKRLGCAPESVKLGDLATLFLHDSSFH